MEIFYSDKIKKFECGLDIDGASLDNTKARLSLSFDNDRTNTKYLYEGNVNSNGNCVIKIPEIKNSPNLVGKVTLEIIAENTFFEPWSDTFIIKQHKNVTVKKITEEVEDDDDKPIIVSVNKTSNSSTKSQLTEKDSSKSILSEKLLEIINENDYIKFVKNLMNNNDLLMEYSNFNPKIITKSLGEMYGITNETKKEKSILFYIEKKVI